MSNKTVLTLLILLLLTACGQAPPEDRPNIQADNNPTETTDPAATTNDSPTRPPTTQRGTTVVADGQLVASQPSLTLSFNTNGQLLTIAVKPGDQVAAGDLLATLDDSALREAVTNAEIQVAQAEVNLAQAQLTLTDLETWEPDEYAIAVAEANLASAQSSYEQAEKQEAADGSTLTSNQVQINQAQRAVADAQEAYDTAWQEARDWELNDPWRGPALEAEREATTRNLESAKEQLQVAYANYNVQAASISGNSTASAAVTVANAEQSLAQATTGPTDSEIQKAALSVTNSELSLAQAQATLAQAQEALADAELRAPWDGTVLSIDTSIGAIVGGGSPILTLFPDNQLEFHTSNLSERDLAEVATGQTAEISLKTYPGQPLTGTVARILPQASGTIGDAATFTVVLTLADTDITLLAGMTGRAEIQAE
ncbi:MAG TPA: HlyD family efflux transporter periplasmic adaptor subunit [Anaerolineae bacterium]|nr:HlyD family efflux transporter periplasmic adaptor subunit [Anaerolineae bacterium]